MAPSTAATQARLRELLASGPPRSGPELARELGISQPTFSRLVRALPDEVVVLGRARATRYTLARPILGVSTPIPVHEVDPEGRMREIAQLHPAGPAGHYVEPSCEDVDAGFYRDLPFFLDSLRPAGFMGRLVPSQYPQLGLPDDVRRWSGDQVLRYATRYGWNLVGSLVAGEDALQELLRRTREPPARISDGEVAERFEALAWNALSGAPPGSSAAGEQPRFLAWRGKRPSFVLVKFSPPRASEVGRRVGDLLVAEHLALRVLRRRGRWAARSRLVAGETRLFLEIERFDRTSRGRRGLVTLEALDNGFVGSGGAGPWLSIAESLVKQGVVPPTTVEPVAFLEAFGALIANTNMDARNLSFFCRGARVLDVASAHDMVPMLYMPQQGNVMTPRFAVPVPRPHLGPVWAAACEAAEELWRAVAQHELTSREFSLVASANANAVARAARLAHRLPHGSARRSDGGSPHAATQ